MTTEASESLLADAVARPFSAVDALDECEEDLEQTEIELESCQAELTLANRECDELKKRVKELEAQTKAQGETIARLLSCAPLAGPG